MDLGQLVWKIEANTTDFNSQVKGTENRAKGLGSKFKSLGNIIKTAFAVTSIIKFGKAVISAAADAQELENKYSVVFGNISDDVNDWIEEYAEATSRGEQDTKSFLTSLQDIRTGFGDNTASAAEFSKAVLGITNDLSSFSNVSFEETFNAIQSGLSGQFEALRRLGVGLNVAIIEQGEYAESINKTWQEMTNLEKQEAILNGILDQSTNAVGQNVESWEDYNFLLGDAAKTSDSFANQVQGLRGEIKDVSADIGSRFIPVATDVVGVARSLVKGFSEMSGGAKELSLEVAGLATAFITGGWIGAAIAGIAILAIEIADAINPIDELEDATDRLISTNEEYNAILQELKESQDSLTESEQIALETRRDLTYGELQGELLTLSDAYDRTSARVDSFREKEEKLLEEQTDLIATYDDLIERNVRTDGTLGNLEQTQNRLASTREDLNEALAAQAETVDKLANSYSKNVLNIGELITANRELADEVINSAAVQGDYVAQVDSLNLAYERGYISTQQYTQQLNALRDAANARQDELAEQAELERQLDAERRTAAAEREREAKEEEERAEGIIDLAEEYRQKLIELNATDQELIEIERRKALATVEGYAETEQAINDYYDALQERREEDEEETKTTLETLKEAYQEYGDYIGELAGLIADAWSDSIDRQLDATLANIEARQNAELEAAGLLEETEREQQEAKLEQAQKTGNKVAEAEALAALKRLDILEKYEQERLQAQYEADLEAYGLAVTMSIVYGALAVAKAFADGGWVQAIIVGALAAVEVGVVAANKPQKPSFQEGGIVPGTSYSGDNVEANVNSGEMILNRGQQANLFNMIKSGGQGAMSNAPIYINLELEGEQVAKVVVDDYINTRRYPIEKEAIR